MPPEPPLLPRKQDLEALYLRWHHRRYLQTDPIALLWDFEAPEDQEAAGFLLSALALGRVSAILQASKLVLNTIGRPLAHNLVHHARSSWLPELNHFVYRFFSASRLDAFLRATGSILERFGSLEAAFASIWPPQERSETLNFEVLGRFSSLFWTPELGILLPRPGSGGAFKRLNLFLRWMARRDEIDPGLWSLVPPQALLAPVDTHVLQWAQTSGVSARKQADAKACLEITAFFRSVNPPDPLRYDFALTRQGMLK